MVSWGKSVSWWNSSRYRYYILVSPSPGSENEQFTLASTEHLGHFFSPLSIHFSPFLNAPSSSIQFRALCEGTRKKNSTRSSSLAANSSDLELWYEVPWCQAETTKKWKMLERRLPSRTDNTQFEASLRNWWSSHIHLSLFSFCRYVAVGTFRYRRRCFCSRRTDETANLIRSG